MQHGVDHTVNSLGPGDGRGLLRGPGVNRFDLIELEPDAHQRAGDCGSLPHPSRVPS